MQAVRLANNDTNQKRNNTMKEYIGDSVYADITDGNIILTTENGIGASNTIFLEPQVFSSHWWKKGEISAANSKPTTLAGALYVTLPRGGVVTHQEHSKIELPAGNYRVIRQREYSPEAILNVQD
jgi:hypothetical protein